MRHLRPIKSFGQSFLTYEPAADDLVAALQVGPGDAVLEIGPGKGVLTRRLAACGCHVIAVEIDRRLKTALELEFLGIENVEIVEGDFMKYPLDGMAGVTVIGNLPYNLSSQMVVKLLDSPPVWSRAVLTTQREFASRILGVPGNKAFGALTVLVDRLCLKRKLFNLPPEYFKPRPDVVSTSFVLERRSQPLFVPSNLEAFRSFVRTCFRQRRKTLANNLVAGVGLDRSRAVAALVAAGIRPSARAEVLRPVQFDELYRRVLELSPTN